MLGDESSLVSPQLPPTDKPGCLLFWYDMDGAQIGSLTVQTTVGIGAETFNMAPIKVIKRLRIP